MISTETILALVILLVVISILLTSCVKKKQIKNKPRKIRMINKNGLSLNDKTNSETSERNNRRVKRLVSEPSDMVEPFKNDRYNESHDMKTNIMQLQNKPPVVNLNNHKIVNLMSPGSDIEIKPNF